MHTKNKISNSQLWCDTLTNLIFDFNNYSGWILEKGKAGGNNSHIVFVILIL